MKEKKVGIKGYEMALCIVGIVVLLGLIMAPPLLRVFVPEENTPSPSPSPTVSPSPTSPVEDFVVMNCKKEEMDANGYTKAIVKNIFHQSGKIKKLEVITTETYLQVNEINRNAFEQSKSLCENIPESYQSVPGYRRECNRDSSAGEVFTLRETYDLVSFVETTIVDTDGSQKVISSEAALDTDYMVLKQKLEETTYVCK